MFILTALPIQTVMMLLCLSVSSWTTDHQWGLVYSLPNAEHPLIKYGLMFIFLDFLDYVYHVTMHNVKAFWRFHLVHHSDQAVDVSTTVREHPGESFIRNCFLILWVFLTGASLEILLLRQLAQTTANLSSHSSIRLPPLAARVVGWLFITPNLHHVHHHFQLPATNRNYGDVFSLWDRLFGTFANLTLADTQFGLQTHMDGSIDARLLALMGHGRKLLAK
ncbi:MAG: sterol desaturase family protein [Gammaproteobacteria bacterium]|nr:sterol desaturase family protein [Gammaproteobacteria bacterium]